MRIIQGLQSYPPDAPASVVALGAFDGVHLAHQKILDVAAGRARELHADAIVCTFDPHPLRVLRPPQAPEPIATLAERLELIAARGIDAAVIIPFTPELSRVEPEVFVVEVLRGTLHAREVVVGFNHTFGRGARGDARLLESVAARLGFVARILPPLTVGGVTVSSSAIRDALRAGDVVAARRFLGRPYTIRGVVVRGAGRGRQLGFPTANLEPNRPLLVARGVYAGYAEVGAAGDPAAGSDLTVAAAAGGDAPAGAGAAGAFKTVVNVGFRPTFGEGRLWVEAYLIEFSGDLYGRTVVISLLERIRDERKFADAEALRDQVHADIRSVASLL